MANKPGKKLFRNAAITTPIDPGKPLSGVHQKDVIHFKNGAIYCHDGIIKAIGNEKDVLNELSPDDVDIEIDCEGLSLIPGFVDPHTHICFADTREEEFLQRMAGTDYLDILKGGGGILSSVQAVRAMSEDDLFAETAKRVLLAQQFGTTTIEIKSGYGLETKEELKMLRVIDRIGRETDPDVIPTFLGAHAIPAEYTNINRSEDYTNIVISEMIPAVAKQGIARFCDIFCEKDVFSIEQSRRILQAAKEAGMGVRLHADEVYDLGGAELAAEFPATSADHLLAVSDNGIMAMAKHGVIGVLLPGTAYCLRKPYAPAGKMIDHNVPIAIATDCNPGSCYTESMPFIFGLAVVNMYLSVSEALVASTLNAAYAVGKAECAGSLDVGKFADFLILDGESPAILAYHAGVSPVKKVYKRGELVSQL
ncbi:MAG: imidazolonepropionase [Candidatus Anammoxibacter sp.]